MIERIPAKAFRMPPNRRGNRVEDGLHKQILHTLRLALPVTAIIHHSPNEQSMAGDKEARQRAVRRNAAMGTMPGFGDIMMLVEGLAMMIEVKAPGGRLSDAQHGFSGLWVANGGRWAVACSHGEALELVKRWMTEAGKGHLLRKVTL